MDFTFSELRCPKCGGKLQSGNTQVSEDVQMVKRYSNRYEQSKLCDLREAYVEGMKACRSTIGKVETTPDSEIEKYLQHTEDCSKTIAMKTIRDYYKSDECSLKHMESLVRKAYESTCTCGLDEIKAKMGRK